MCYHGGMKEETTQIEAEDLVQMQFLEGVARRLPSDGEVLKALGDFYTRVGRYEDGLSIDRRLAKLHPRDAMVWYNLGCSLALLRKREAALKALRRAVSLGYRDHEWMSRDDDLRSLREDRAFKSLLQQLSSETEEVADEGYD
jgi:Flp pilus assembly protein TadD